MGNFHSYYQEFEILGEGCVGLVKKVRHIVTGQYFACKTVKLKDEETVMQVIREFKNIKQLNHSNIVKMYELYVDEVKSRIYTIMELVEAKEMFEVIRKLGSYSEQIASKIFKQILSSIRYMHEQRVCHRDLKPNNILATEDGLCVKITDFNISKFGIESKKDKFFNMNIKMWTYTGTVSFSAPEIFSESEYDQSVDIWSAGVVLYTMLSGQEPFQAEYLKDLIYKIQTANYSFPTETWDHVSEEAKDLIRKCLILNPEERIKPDQALLHPWITGKQNTSPLTLIIFNNFENNAHRLSKQVNAYEKLGLIKIQERKKSVDSSILRQHQLRSFYIKNNSNSSTSTCTEDQTSGTSTSYGQKNFNQVTSEQGSTQLSFTQSNQNSCNSSPYQNPINHLQSQLESSPNIKNLCKLTESIEETTDCDSGLNSPQIQRSPRIKKYHKTLIIHDRYRLSEQDQFIIQQNEIIASSTSSLSHTITDEIIDQTFPNLNGCKSNGGSQIFNHISSLPSVQLSKANSRSRYNEFLSQNCEQSSYSSINSIDGSQSTLELINFQINRSKFFIPPSILDKMEDEQDETQTSISPKKKRKQPKNNTCLINTVAKNECYS